MADTQIETVVVDKDFKKVICGTITTFKDQAGNLRYHANRVVDNDKFTFWNKGTAEHWMRLGGLLHG